MPSTDGDGRVFFLRDEQAGGGEVDVLVRQLNHGCETLAHWIREHGRPRSGEAECERIPAPGAGRKMGISRIRDYPKSSAETTEIRMMTAPRTDTAASTSPRIQNAKTAANTGSSAKISAARCGVV